MTSVYARRTAGAHEFVDDTLIHRDATQLRGLSRGASVRGPMSRTPREHLTPAQAILKDLEDAKERAKGDLMLSVAD